MTYCRELSAGTIIHMTSTSGLTGVAGVPLACDAAKEISGHISAVRKSENLLMSKHRPFRPVHRAAGWTAEILVEQALPVFRPSLLPLDVTTDVFSWSPI